MSQRRMLFGVVVLIVAAASAWAGPEASGEPRGWLGVRLSGGAGADGEGVPVARVIQDSPAHESGLRAGDVVLTVDGQPVRSSAALIQAIQQKTPGSWIPLTVDRRGGELDLRVRLDERPHDLGKARARRGWIGVKAIALPAALREHFGAPAEAGVMISEIEAASPAESAGFELGDVVYEVDGRPVATPGQLYERLAGGGIGNVIEARVARSGLDVDLEALIEPAPAGESKR